MTQAISYYDKIKNGYKVYYSTSQFQEAADAVSKSKTQGHVIINPDGSIVLIPEVKTIVGTYLLHNLGRNSCLH